MSECKTKPAGMTRRELFAGAAATGMLAAGGIPLAARAAGAAKAAAPQGPVLADRLAAYAHGLAYDDLGAGTVEAVKVRFVDALGCAIAALKDPKVTKVREAMLELGGRTGSSTVIGTDRKVSVDLAAFANGAAIRNFDLNDVYLGRQAGHPSDNIAPCLAVAEAGKLDGRSLITAVALAYEIDCRFLDAFDTDGNGWDHPIFSLPAVALAVGKLMGLTPAQMTQAVNLAMNDHLALHQTRVQNISDWKNLADAEAGRNAIFAAILAGKGVTGPGPIFEGKDGIFKMVTKGALPIDVASFGGKGRRFLIEDCAIKRYPAQVYTQTAVAAASAVAAEVGDLSKIVGIDVATSRKGFLFAAHDAEKWAPKTKGTADHSLPYIVSRSMLDRNITFGSYTQEMLQDPKLLHLIKMVKVHEEAELTAMLPKKIPTRVTARLADGRSVTRQVDALPGFAGMAMPRGDVEKKFRDTVGKAIPSERIARLLEVCWNLELQNDLSAVLRLLA